MILKNSSYKRAMEKIVVSDELKNKILQNASDFQSKSARSKTLYIKYGVGLVACFAVFVVSSIFFVNHIDDKNLPLDSALVETEKSNEVVTKEKNQTKEVLIPDKKDDKKQLAEKSYSEENNVLITEKQEPENKENIISDEDVNTYVSNNANDKKETFVDKSDFIDAEVDSLKIAQEKVEYDVKAPTFMPKGYEIDNITLTQDDSIKVTYQNDFDLVTYTIGDEDYDNNLCVNRYSVIRTEDVNGISVTLKGNGNIYNDIEWNDGKTYSIYSENGFLIYTAKRIVESIDSVI